MVEGGGLPSLVLRMTLLLLHLVVASLQLQARKSRKAVKENNIATARSARSVKHESVVVGEAADRGVSGRVQCRVQCRAVPVDIDFPEQMEVKKRTRINKMEKNTLYAVLRIFLESVKVAMPATIQALEEKSALQRAVRE